MLAKGSPELEVGVHRLPAEFDDAVARLKLESLGVEFDELTPDQEDYLASWDQGT
jgi:adenosylhomocysteinase